MTRRYVALALPLLLASSGLWAALLVPDHGLKLRLSQGLAGAGSLKLSGALARQRPANASAEPIIDTRPSGRQLGALLAEPGRCGSVQSTTTEPQDLSSVLAAIICRSALVQAGRGQQMQAQAALQRAEAFRQPGLNLSTGVDAASGSDTSWSAVLRLDWVLFDFGSGSAGLQQARALLSSSLAEQRSEMLNALAAGAQLFAEAQASRGRTEAASVNLQTADDNASAAIARHGAGAATLAEKLQAETALAQARLVQSRVQSQWLSARGALAVAMGLPVTQAIDVQRIDSAALIQQTAALNLEALLAEARASHPRVMAARARLNAAEAQESVARADRWGRVGLNAQTGRSRASSSDGINLSTTATLGWTLPLFDRSASASRILDAQGQIQQQTVGVEASLRQIELLVWQQAHALRSEQEGLLQSQKVLASAEASLRVSGGRFRQGVGNFTDLLSAQNIAANARFQVIEAQANLCLAQLRLAAAVGRLGPL